MPTLRMVITLILTAVTGLGVYMILSGNQLGPWLLVFGGLGTLVSGWPYWFGPISPEVWEMLRDYFNCRWY